MTTLVRRAAILSQSVASTNKRFSTHWTSPASPNATSMSSLMSVASAEHPSPVVFVYSTRYRLLLGANPNSPFDQNECLVRRIFRYSTSSPTSVPARNVLPEDSTHVNVPSRDFAVVVALVVGVLVGVGVVVVVVVSVAVVVGVVTVVVVVSVVVVDVVVVAVVVVDVDDVVVAVVVVAVVDVVVQRPHMARTGRPAVEAQGGSG